MNTASDQDTMHLYLYDGNDTETYTENTYHRIGAFIKAEDGDEDIVLTFQIESQHSQA